MTLRIGCRYGRAWPQIVAYVGSRSVAQVRGCTRSERFKY